VKGLFELNPSLYLELGRVLSDLSHCIVLSNLRREEHSALKEIGLKVISFKSRVDRIVSSKEPIFSPHTFYYVFKHSSERFVVKTLEKIERLEKKPSLKNRLKINELEGEILGYPDCCISSFVNLKRGSVEGKTPPETKTVLECMDSNVFLDVLKAFPEPKIPYCAYSLFTSNFYPCSIGCKKAIEIGKKCESFFDEIDSRFGLFYRCKIVSNVLGLLVPIFEVSKIPNPKTDFGKRAKDFVVSLGDLKPKAEKVISIYRLNPIEFENDYILYVSSRF
jgi:hypothetical protein